MSEAIIAETQQGKLAGASANGVRAWLGVPYAKAGRFEAPATPPAWNGVRQATSMGAQCPQGMGKRTMADGPAYGEDCLVLNIWAPEKPSAAPRPVLFWIHGGAFLAGSANQYNGAELAKRGDMIVVGINYRVGALGFVNFGEALGLPAIPSNLGLRDQLAALRWVHDNIAGFGGDPARVTICGQSAGSMSVSLLMLAQEAWPYFNGAIMQSGAVSLIHDRAMSLKVARRYADLLDLNQGGLEKLKSMPVKQLLATQGQVQSSIGEATIPAAPWYDGDLLPGSLLEAHTALVAQTPLIAGFTRDEIRTFEFLGGPEILPMKRASLERIVRAQLPPSQAEAVLAAYPATKAGQRALATDLNFGMPTRNFAERHARQQPSWFYRFDYAHPIAGAFHGLDLAFIWPIKGLIGAALRGGPNSGVRRALAERLQDHLIHFVQHGRPMADWPRYDAGQYPTLLFNKQDRLVDDPEADRRRAWQGKDVGPGITAAFD